jgi:hypothetical protein
MERLNEPKHRDAIFWQFNWIRGGGLASLANPIAAAAQSVGVKPGDLPDLTIKEVKVYVTDISKIA